MLLMLMHLGRDIWWRCDRLSRATALLRTLISALHVRRVRVLPMGRLVLGVVHHEWIDPRDGGL